MHCVATLDALCSLAITSTVGDNRGECVRPVFVARLASIPEPILQRAKIVADKYNIDMNLQTPEVNLFMFRELEKRLKAVHEDDPAIFTAAVKNLLKNVL